MSSELSRFRIDALHNIRTIDVPIEDNKLVLVGENGTGKSTVANLIYFFLTRQWHRMLNYQFRSITATINSKEITIPRDDLTKWRLTERDRSRLSRLLPNSTIEAIRNMLVHRSIDEVIKSNEILQYSNRHGIPRSVLMDFIYEFNEQQVLTPTLENAIHTLDHLVTDQVLYLPTYRRIEQDLASIFSGPISSDLRSALERWTHRAEGSSYIELVEFGMQDVEQTIQKKMSELGASLRNDLNNLTGTYLRDVIQGAYLSAEPSAIIELNDTTMEAIFSRIDKQILPEHLQKRLRDIVAKIKRDNSIPQGDKVVVHFLTTLIELYKTQQENERDVREFVRVCNDYLKGKEFVYDNLRFDISMYQRDFVIEGDEKNKLRKIEMPMLSSGEKQIVSLFSHIYLSGKSGYLVIMDEPELSLSVPWQKRFLPDILATGRCSGLIAVTHSPFIFENELEKYTHEIDEFVEPLNDIS